MKEPDYVMSPMTTYGTTELMGDARLLAYEINCVKRRKTIVYPEVVYNHFQFRDAVDANNGMRMPPPFHRTVFHVSSSTRGNIRIKLLPSTVSLN